MDFIELRNKVYKGEYSLTEVVKNTLNKILINDKKINSFITLFKEKSLKKATEVEKKIKNGNGGRLAGLIIAIKDIICIKNERVTCGSKILKDFISPYNATVIEKLEKDDAIIIGKTNMDEFAMGSSNETSYFGPAKNPWDYERVPGGSSGGSAAAVSAGFVPAALGTDTGGSIRQPASFCGIVGLKPTYGRVSRFGLVAFASSLDQIGTLTSSTKTTAYILQSIAGYDPKDSTSVNIEVPEYVEHLNDSISEIKIALPVEYFGEGLDKEIRESIYQVIDNLKKQNIFINEVSLPHTEFAIATYYILATAEASSNLARYDGARYGFRYENSDDLEEMYKITRTEGFGDEVKRRIMLGTYVLSAGYYEAYYRKAQKVRRLIKEDFDKVFKDYDCIITPIAPTPAFKIGEKIDNPLKMYLSDIYTISVNLAGLPGISIPCGLTSKNLPIGLQIIGKQFDELTILKLANYIENHIVKENYPDLFYDYTYK
ncbi:Asp-tRNA(Asn)/Glu-tRNA(Gln) amidotransferase GatCAB subunit A [candidate division KSB1 bacterium]|nr:MAG: Asp-tRNA(Asn)/Glu-tRNA(Gln) amidotransferase GatCAB subunit A [candidate division KSB1 bacterium]